MLFGITRSTAGCRQPIPIWYRHTTSDGVMLDTKALVQLSSCHPALLSINQIISFGDTNMKNQIGYKPYVHPAPTSDL